MRDIIAELKSLRLNGMVARYEALVAEGSTALKTADWLLRALLETEVTDRHMRSIRYQLGAARFPVHRALASFDFGQSKVGRNVIATAFP